MTGPTDDAPLVLTRPAEPPAPLELVGQSPALRALREARAGATSTPGRSTLRGWAAKITGRSDGRLLHALADATEVLAARCDEVLDRLAAQEALAADLVGTLGAELTRLRAEVLHLQRTMPTPGDRGG